MLKAYLMLLAGYVGWGLFPLYWQLLAHISSLEVTLHRIVWSVPVLAILVHFSRMRYSAFITSLNSATELKFLLLTSILISLNWGIYIWAVAHARVVEASMGYFLSPLIHIVAGVLLFKEKLSQLQWMAVSLASIGVGYYIFSQGVFPWVGLSVGFSFAAYGILRKKIASGAVAGLYIETLIMAPLALLGLLILHSQGTAAFLNIDINIDLLFIVSGLVTVIPLALFTYGTKLLPLTSVGILFFITPSMQFIAGTFILNEAMNPSKLMAFGIIWTGLLIYSIALIKQRPVTV